jgi:3-(3-hydroxy-phenyl)propionate hydroxylase
MSESDVLIVGAGPVGLIGALALVKQRLSVTVIESESDLVIDQRAGSIQPTTLEMFATLGLAEQFVSEGLVAPIYHFRDRETGSVIAAFNYAVLRDETDFPFVLQYEQYKITRDVFTKHGGKDFDVLFSHRAVEIVQDDTGVTVTAERPDGSRQDFRAKYLLGADGAHSVVRKSQNIGFEGFTYPERFVKIATRFDFSTVFPNLCPRTYLSDPAEWCNLFKVKGDDAAGIWRTVFPTQPGETEADALSEEGLERRMQRLHSKSGRYDVENCAIYSVSQRVAGTFESGRVLLVGDAAHVNNPIGGLGLNSGIHDVMNLADKLPRVVRKEAGPELLALYGRQRRQTALNFVQEQTVRNKRMLEEKDQNIRRTHFEELRRTSEQSDLARAFLRRSTLAESLKAAAGIH